LLLPLRWTPLLSSTRSAEAWRLRSTGAPRATKDIDLMARSSTPGSALWVVSRAGLITLKLAAGRPQDIVDVQRLEESARGEHET
jgi:hypothetical protein